MKHIHLIGIGGTGLSAIARVLLEKGYKVSGSDRTRSPILESLEALGAIIHIGHQAEQVGSADIVLRSSAVPLSNPEVKHAIEAGIPVMKRTEFLGFLLEGHPVIAIAGTHGKTTTTSMIAWILSSAGHDPSFIIGGVSQNLKTNAHAGKADGIFVIEADEYDNMFHGIKPDTIILTNIEHDHPDMFPTRQEYQDSFMTFARGIQPGGAIIACNKDPGAVQVSSQLCREREDVRQVMTGVDAADFDLTAYIPVGLKPNKHGGYDFKVRIGQDTPLDDVVRLIVPGRHNVLNALCAFAAAHIHGVPVPQITDALSEYRGAERRFDLLAEIDQVALIDDYAHHPAEIKATLAAARQRYPEREIWAVWQPHTFSRIQAFLPDFLQAFSGADHVVVTEVYGAREDLDGFSAAQIASQIDHQSTTFIQELNLVALHLGKRLTPPAAVLVFSAGDADKINRQLAERLKARENIQVRNE